MAHATSTITTGGTAQPLFAARFDRGAFYVQNNSAGDLRIQFDGSAAVNSGIKLAPGSLYESPPGVGASGTVSIWGATTGQEFQYGDF